MGAKNSKPQPRRIEPEVTAVEVFPDATEAQQGSSGSPKRQKVSPPSQGGTTHVVRSILHDASDTQSNRLADTETQDDAKEKQKKKRRRSKKDKNKSSPPKLVRAQTQLNELKNVKPLLQQSPHARQQHFEQIKDAYALDEDARKAPSQDGRSRFFNFESWRKTPEKGDSPGREPIALLTRSQSSGASRGLFASTGRSVRSPRGTEEISNDIEDLEDSHEIESLALPPPSRTTAITAPTVIISPFLAASNQVEYGRPDIQTTPVIRVKTSDRQTPERSKRSLQQSDLRLDDVDEDLMEHILTDEPQ
ncbi:hypothetical protein P3T76_003162 [Phytophthora citrophthora]|uniref:Uncharacterized protein n=1 Tax=Phytophthora citrophthora TaxID=4793 RepID=A0AAD9GWX7_9STRA|nr:hypothetical protein P3T76_003162 [Phytophthora citrophthora]